MLQKIQKFLSQKGQGIVEYAMVLGFVAVLAIGLWQSGLFESTQNTFGNVTKNVNTVSNTVEKADMTSATEGVNAKSTNTGDQQQSTESSGENSLSK